jgi:hypothetical protein
MEFAEKLYMGVAVSKVYSGVPSAVLVMAWWILKISRVLLQKAWAVAIPRRVSVLTIRIWRRQVLIAFRPTIQEASLSPSVWHRQ